MTTVGPYKYVEENARVRPNDPAVIHGPVTLTFAQVHELAGQIGTAMREYGLKPGQTALILTGHHLRDYLFSLATMHEAAVSVAQLGPKYNPAIEADIAFTVAPIEGFPAEKTFAIDQKFQELSQSIEIADPISYPEENPVVRLFQTSGTTGLPKVMEYDFESLCRMGDVVRDEQPAKTICLLPYGLAVGTFIAFYSIQDGIPFYLATRNVTEDKKMIGHYKLEAILSSPAQVADLFADDNIPGWHASLKRIICGGAIIPKQLVTQIRQRSNAAVWNRFGSSEGGALSGFEVSATDAPGKMGKPYSDTTFVIVDDDFNELPAGEVGRIGTKTSVMRHGYRNNPEATAKHFVDGFFFSGDEGYVDEEGCLYMGGRQDERINSGGIKADAAILDADIREIDGVKDAAVFGFDRKSGIRAIAAVLVLEPGAKMPDVVKRIDAALGSKRPMAYIETTKVPRNLMGKVQRVAIENQHSADAKKLVD